MAGRDHRLRGLAGTIRAWLASAGGPSVRPTGVPVSEPVSVAPEFRHRPALDAVRGVAVLVVVAFHSELGFG